MEIKLKFALATDDPAQTQRRLAAPLHARPPALTPKMSAREVARLVLRETFLQFTANLNSLRTSTDPEVLHQARIGWRRFKSALQLFNKHPDLVKLPALEPLRPLLQAMTRLRDLEVAAAQTLPMFANAYTAGSARRQNHWRSMEQALSLTMGEQRGVVLGALQAPVVGCTLVEITQWLEIELAARALDSGDTKKQPPVGDWVLRRVARLHARLKDASADSANSADAQAQHRIRILSKRLRYCVQALSPVLPHRKIKRWDRLATRLQTQLGATRDMARAVEIVAQLKPATGLVEFLRGVAFGERLPAKGC